MKQAVLIMAYGGPDSLADIEPYLLDIRGGRPTPPAFVEDIRQRYTRIGGYSPLLTITRSQASALEGYLNQPSRGMDLDNPYRVYVGMRHWKPYIQDAVALMAREGFQSGIALCMAPHASRMSTEIYRQKLLEAQSKVPDPVELTFIESWHDCSFLIRALAKRVKDATKRFPVETQPEIHFLFTAHSLPAILEKEGDPYSTQLLETTRLLARELDLSDEQWTFGFQSAGAAPGQWMGPAIEDILANFSHDGVKNILVTPIGFMADNVEILYDLDIEAQEIARQHHIRLVRSDTLNASPDFIEGLASLVLDHKKKPQLNSFRQQVPNGNAN